MQLENQVCSLPLAQRLKELGVKQESIFHWATYEFNKTVWKLFSQAQTAVSAPVDFYSAFTVAELGEMLPNHSYFHTPSTPNGPEEWDIDGIRIMHEHEGDKWISFFDTDTYILDIETHEPFEAPTEADARAKMLIYLLENKLITL